MILEVKINIADWDPIIANQQNRKTFLNGRSKYYDIKTLDSVNCLQVCIDNEPED